jgi:hypothetical protein
MTKLMIGLLVALSVAMVSNSNATGAAETVTYEQCLGTCAENMPTICKPAYEAQSQGRLTQEQVDQLCQCGVLVCANACLTESDASSQVRALPQVCYDIGAY